MIALAVLLSVLANFGVVIGIAVATSRAHPIPLALLGLVVAIILFGCVQIVVFGPVLWILHRRKLATRGRRWFALTGLAAGFLEGGALLAPAMTKAAYSPAFALVLILMGGVCGSLLGALGGLLFSLTATRRVPLEAVFE